MQVKCVHCQAVRVEGDGGKVDMRYHAEFESEDKKVYLVIREGAKEYKVGDTLSLAL